MPTVRVQLIAGRSAEQKKACGVAVTEALIKTLNTSPESIQVVFEEIDATDWFTAGVSIADARKKAAAA
jgi:4-oxalocrotonate tautomerase